MRLCAFPDRSEDFARYCVDILIAVHGNENALLAIVIQQRSGLIIVQCEAALDCRGSVILALHQLATTFVTDVLDSWRIGFHVIHRATVLAGSPPAKTGDEDVS